jgi:hypothetical protein
VWMSISTELFSYLSDEPTPPMPLPCASSGK